MIHPAFNGPILLATGDPVGTVLTYFFLVVTQLGGQPFFLLIIPYLYWGRDRRLGLEMAIMLLTGFYINLYLKEWFKIPRPSGKAVPWGLENESYSFPSGHAQGTVAFWTYLSLQIRTRWTIIAGVVLTILISYSRIYLEVHRWMDIFGGLALGLAIAISYHLLKGPAARALLRIGHAPRLALAIVIPLAMFLATGSVTFGRLMGFLMGAMAGAEIETSDLGMPDCKNGRQRWKRLTVGYTLCAIIMFGLGHFGPNVPGWQFVVYTLAGMGVTLFAPLIFSTFERWD